MEIAWLGFLCGDAVMGLQALFGLRMWWVAVGGAVILAMRRCCIAGDV